MLLGDRPVATEDPDDVLVPPGATLEFLPPSRAADVTATVVE